MHLGLRWHGLNFNSSLLITMLYCLIATVTFSRRLPLDMWKSTIRGVPLIPCIILPWVFPWRPRGPVRIPSIVFWRRWRPIWSGCPIATPSIVLHKIGLLFSVLLPIVPLPTPTIFTAWLSRPRSPRVGGWPVLIGVDPPWIISHPWIFFSRAHTNTGALGYLPRRGSMPTPTQSPHRLRSRLPRPRSRRSTAAIAKRMPSSNSKSW